mmetsp:Transcript_37444/g.45615  ORF Transcript_37444/g.45615 Transcript_37444/m.45615 type:complete len:127 (+) Transcript_37444:211-591(+)
MPIYGKKSIGCRYCTLDIHGVHKESWSELETTVTPGDKKLTVNSIVNWEVGDIIMVTSTNYNQWEAELKTLTRVEVNGENTILSIDSAFKHTHHGGVETLGSIGDTLEIRAEVALMSRNVVYRGDP